MLHRANEKLPVNSVRIASHRYQLRFNPHVLGILKSHSGHEQKGRLSFQMRKLFQQVLVRLATVINVWKQV
jgi:hypothetical protein